MPDIVGQAIDQICTLDIKNRGMPHNVLAPMYAAARKLTQGRPISIAAAEMLVASVAPGDRVLILTGAGYPPQLPHGESDGPPGAAALARILHRGLGAVPIYVVERAHLGPVVASSNAAGVSLRETYDEVRDTRLGAIAEVAPDTGAEVAGWVAHVLDTYRPSAVISAERIGPGAQGVLHSATGIPFSPPKGGEIVDISPLVEEATRRGIPTLGIGDYGNEIGFGAIRDTVMQVMPRGPKLATTTATDIVFPSMMSNWGCYGIEAAIAFLLRRPDLIHSPEVERRVLYACLDAGGYEAIHCTTDFQVDGLDGESSMAVVQLLGNIVRKNLEAQTSGFAH
ncbi:glutamate cyclase domain-containing protein [Arenibacterium sp. LLYu02]|uniref:glutamate cyclase domain-containing protein n=1 Tax=Arenibacterium sp. LLYu02 TaxID=3404132 RepID=UPI003B21D15C